MPVSAQIPSDDAFTGLVWEKILEDDIEGSVGVVQSVCATETYIICLENYADGSGKPDIVKAYYRNDTDENGNKVEKYSLAKRVAETDYEHANGMAYNPETNEIAVSLYTDADPANEGCLFIMDAETLKYKRTVKVLSGCNILGIGYDKESRRYVIQTNAEDGYQFYILNEQFQVVETLGDMQGYAGDGNYQDLCVTGDYILNFPLTLFSGVGDYLNVYSISEKKMLRSEKQDFRLENVVRDEPESICELEPGVFVAAVNVRMADGTDRIRLYRTEVPYDFSVAVSRNLGEEADIAKTTVARGTDFTVTYGAEKGYEIESVTIDEKAVDLEKFSDTFRLKNVQSDHVIRIHYVEKSPVIWLAVLAAAGILSCGSGLALYLRVLEVRRIRRRKLEAERRRRARIKWQNDEWEIDDV